MTMDAAYFGLVIELLEDGDVRALLDDKDTHISNEQKWQMLMDIAEVNMKQHQLTFHRFVVRPDCHSPSDYSGETAGYAISE